MYAPVIIPTLCRFEHFKRCIESLARCTDANKTELYIGLDYPTKDSHWDGYHKICNYVDSISGFKQVFIVRHEKNLGPTANTEYLRTMVKKKHDRFICSEDDNEFAPNFLCYMNQCLTKYKENPNILYVCGWSNPRYSSELVLDKFIYNAYPMHGFSAFGYGGWFNRPAVKYCKKEELIYSFRNTFWAMIHHHSLMIHNILPFMKSKTQFGDIMREYYCARNGIYCIFPTISKVRNWGFDGDGEHCVIWEDACRAKIDTNINFLLDDFEIKDYPEIRCVEKLVYDETPKFKLYFFVEYIWFRLTKKLVKETWLFRKIKRFVFK